MLQALQAMTEGDTESARELAAAAPGLLGPALAKFLGNGSAEGVYATPEGFEAFIEGGGNIPLYQATSAALAELYDEHRPASLLDIGCGNGRALLPALRSAEHAPPQIDLLEPSEALLAGVQQAVAARRVWPCSLQTMLEAVEPETHWDLAQSTFALHNLPHQERTQALTRLRPHVGRLAVVEFDVPALAPAENLAFLAETYERGLAEYDTDRDLVAQGFLMPVLVGQLRPGAPRVTFEQTKGRWQAQLLEAGFGEIEFRPLYPYWSSPAFLVTAR
ncbi:class I SAM-dependent methyltransferase [Kineosporia babensis]